MSESDFTGHFSLASVRCSVGGLVERDTGVGVVRLGGDGEGVIGHDE